MLKTTTQLPMTPEITPTQIKLQVGVKIFLKNKEGKFLLLKRNPVKYGKVKGEWDIVGGRINLGIDLLENLRREVKEETQLTIISTPYPPRLIAAQDIIRLPEKHVVRLSYVGQGEGDVVLDTVENTEYKWVTLEELHQEENLDEYAKEIIKAGLLAEGLLGGGAIM